MSQLTRDTAAGLLARVWVAVLGLAVVPQYLQALGIEAYGLIGFYLTLLSLLALLDVSVGLAANRQLARLGTTPNGAAAMRDLVRSLEVTYWLLAAVAGASLLVVLPLIAAHWWRSEALPADTVRAAALAMALAVALQLPYSLYTSVLLGRHRQLAYNALLVGAQSLRALGALAVLWWVAASIEAFMAWQIAVALVQTSVAATLAWRSLPRGTATVRLDRLREIARFASGAGVVGLLAIVLTQGDKLLLSGLVTLEQYGYYALAALVVTGLYTLVVPFSTAVFPQLSVLVARRDEGALAVVYHQSCQLLAVCLLPIALTGVCFAYEALLLWTRDATVASNTHLILSVLLVGTALHGLVFIPYSLQMAYGWTRLGLYQNAAALALLGPLLWWATGRWQGVGAAAVWTLLTLGYCLVSVPIMHRRLLPGELWPWYRDDVARPLAGALAVVLPLRAVYPTDLSYIPSLAYLGLTVLLAAGAAALVTPASRHGLSQLLARTTIDR